MRPAPRLAAGAATGRRRGIPEMAREWALREALATDEFGFMDFAQKEETKRALGFATLPFTVVVQDGAVVASGDPLAPGSMITSAIRQIL